MTLLAFGEETIEQKILGSAWLETLNLALVTGVWVRSSCKLKERFSPGIKFSSRSLLNIAIALLGATFSIHGILAVRLEILFSVVGVVSFSLVFTFWVGKVAGLSRSQSILVACGNSICGNSAIMAVAPVIRARDEDTGATIAFTAAGGLVIVLALPLLIPFLHLSEFAEGSVAGLVVYAVPQVMAAAAPLGPVAVHIGMLIKLVRVLMLGPICIIFLVLYRRKNHENSNRDGGISQCFRSPCQLVPWYITGFVLMMILRSLGIIPEVVVPLLDATATVLTTMAMAALGLSIDIRLICKTSKPLVITVALSLAGLVSASLALTRLLI